MAIIRDNTNIDPINYLSELEKAKLDEKVKKLSPSQIMELRQQAVILKDKYRTNASKVNATSVAIFENATMTKIDILNTKRAVTGVNYVAKQMAAEGRKEANGILEKFSQNYYGDNIIRDVQGLNPYQEFKKYNDFEEAKPLSVKMAETTAQNDEQADRLQARVGTTSPASGSQSILDPDKGYLANFKDKEAAYALLKNCIPCEFRIGGDFSAVFSTPWQATIKDMNKKWKDLANMLKGLTTFRPGEFSADLCNLFKFLDGQCIPDITGLMSLLSIMQLKYTDLSGTSLQNIINQLIAPFLTPVIGAFTSNLDQYVDLIVGPLRCIVRALEQQIVTLQEQVNGAYNIAGQNKIKYQKAQIDFYDAKIKSLRNRKLQMQRADEDRSIRRNGGTGADVALDGNVTAVRPYPSLGSDVPDLTRQEKIVQTKLVTNGIRIGGTLKSNGESNLSQVSNAEELSKIDSDILALQNRKNIIREDISNDSPYSPTNFNGAVSLTRQSQVALSSFERSSKALIGDLTDAVNDGINVIQQSIDVYREEFQRLILGRVSTQQDQLEYTRLLQQIARLTSIVGTVHELGKAGFSLKKLCEKGEQNALSQIAKGIKQNDTNNMFDFYQAADADGNPLIVIAPGGATVNVNSIDYSDVTDDALFAESSFDLDSVTKTVSFNDLNEVDKLNREGIVPNLGNIDGKQIELSNKTKVGSELDLHFKSSYAIISNEFCSKSAITFGSSDSVKQWAESLWQKK